MGTTPGFVLLQGRVEHMLGILAVVAVVIGGRACTAARFTIAENLADLHQRAQRAGLIMGGIALDGVHVAGIGQ